MISKTASSLSGMDAAALAHKLATSLSVDTIIATQPLYPQLKDLLLKRADLSTLRHIIGDSLDKGLGETLMEIGLQGISCINDR